MTRRTRVLLGLALVSACSGVWLLAGRDPAPRADRSESQGANGEAPPSGAPAPAPAIERERSSPQPVPQGDFTRNRATLETLARAGNAEAAQRLGDVLRHCAPARITPPAASGYLSWTGVHPNTRTQRTEPTPPAADLVDLGGLGVLAPNTYLMPAEIERIALCDGVRHYTEADRAAAYDWLVLAADLGSPPAMAQRFDLELEHIGTHPAARVEQAARLVALRPRARAMLHRAADMGEPRALARLSRAHASGDLAAKDAVLADAYELAADTMFARSGAPGTQALQRLRATGDTERIARAEAAADDILARCCAQDTP